MEYFSSIPIIKIPSDEKLHQGEELLESLSMAQLKGWKSHVVEELEVEASGRREATSK